jgi:ketosteroid isomerase-like protein
MLMARGEAAITQTYTDYVHAFQTLDPHAVLSYCHVPCMVLSTQAVCVMATPAEVEALFIRLFKDLKARNYARSEITDLHVHQMSENIAMLRVSRVRYTTDGHELERLGETYTFRNTADGWKIVVATMHDPHTI